MSTSNEHSAWVCALSWVAALLATGCFDVERVDVRVSGSQIIRIDDFEDGNTLPSDRRFGPWQCFPFSSTQLPPTCRISAGYAGGHGLSMEFELGGDAIGVAYGTAMIPSVKGGKETLDVTSLSRIGFDMKWDIDSPELNSGNVVAVHLPCISLKYTDGASPSGYAVEHNLTPGSDWYHYSLVLDEFEQPAWPSVRIARRDCLPLLDGVDFNVTAPDSLAGGQLATGTISVDNVHLE
jgi:hypothetical protein